MRVHATRPRRSEPVEPPDGFAVNVNDDAPIYGKPGCDRFQSPRRPRGVDPTRPTPPWMVSRLRLAGIRSISLAVDITNYVMLELGQPIHGYDLDKLTGGITIRRADGGREDRDPRRQSACARRPEDLLITDDSGPIGLAGVMGGQRTEIGDTTTNVLVEAANFDPVSIARTARRHKLPSEASRRFERGVDPQGGGTRRGARGAAAGRARRRHGRHPRLGLGWFDPTAPHRPSRPLHRRASSASDTRQTRSRTRSRRSAPRLPSLDDCWTVTPPTWRPDLDDKSTLAEEVARIVGYDRIPSILPVAPPGRGLTREQRLRRSVANGLAAAGLTEVLAYPFVSKASNDLFGAPIAGGTPSIKLANPLDPDAPFMRTSLWPGLVAVARRNLSRGLTDLALYELGTVVLPAAGTAYGSGPLPSGVARPSDEVLEALRASIPPQPWHVGALFLGDTITKQPGQSAVTGGLADALDAARQVAALVAAPLTVATGSHQALHPGRTAESARGRPGRGYAGELLPSVAADLDLPRVVGLLELDLDALLELATKDVAPTAIASLPAATQDVSLVVPIDVRAGELLAALVEGAGDLLEHATLTDDYRGPGVPDGTKSLTYALRFRAPDRTLTQAEATEAKTAAVQLALNPLRGDPARVVSVMPCSPPGEVVRGRAQPPSAGLAGVHPGRAVDRVDRLHRLDGRVTIRDVRAAANRIPERLELEGVARVLVCFLAKAQAGPVDGDLAFDVRLERHPDLHHTSRAAHLRRDQQWRFRPHRGAHPTRHPRVVEPRIHRGVDAVAIGCGGRRDGRLDTQHVAQPAHGVAPEVHERASGEARGSTECHRSAASAR